MPGKQNYGDPAYWEKRYKENSNETFDWLQDWATLRPIVLRLVPNKAAAVLNLGCGNAAIAERMFDEGYSGITNVDISKEVIAQMKKRNEEKRPGLKFMVMDVRKLDFDEASFDFVLDKSTIDALYCGEKASRSVAAMLKEVKRVLRPAGFYLGLSYGQPKSRLLGYESPELGFFVSSHRLYDYLKLDVFGAKATKDQKNLDHYLYFCAKDEAVLAHLAKPSLHEERREEKDKKEDKKEERKEDKKESPAPKKGKK